MYLIREGDTVTSVAHMNGLLRAHGGMLLSTFPNVGIALMLYLTLPVTNIHQKSFSTLARIKNHLRASMGQTRLSALSLVCIESNTPPSETLERISMKLGIYNRAAGMPTHANPCGAATTWVVWANT